MFIMTTVVMQMSGQLEIWTGCTVGIVILRCKIIVYTFFPLRGII